MGDIARHRDIFLNTRDSVPADLLSRCKLAPGDLTYLELGNYFTDVSQFRDPVFYLFAKQTVWRDEVLPGAENNTKLTALKAVLQLLAAASAAAIAKEAEGKTKALALLPAAASPVLAGLNSQINDLAADLLGVDEWIDGMLGKPIEHLDQDGKRKPEDYGFVGRFFQHFICAITHMLFAQDVSDGPRGTWREIPRIPAAEVTRVFDRAFTQYFPHEHTDQPPYVWDASDRPGKSMYEPGPRRLNKSGEPAGRPRGIMNVVYEHYINYLAEGLSRLENNWRQIKPQDQDARRLWLVEMGKLLHGVEDWFFHSNVVELIRLHAYRPDEVAPDDQESFAKRTILAELKKDPEYQRAGANQKRLQRFFYRRLRFPVYGKRTRENTGGVPSTKTSILNWDHAYPAFPSTLDTAHTLLGALEGIEGKLQPHAGGAAGGVSGLISGAHWLGCVFKKFHAAGPEWSKVFHDKAAARQVKLDKNGMPSVTNAGDQQRVEAWAGDVLRELLPMVFTLLHERERQRLVDDVNPMDMPLDGSRPKPKPGAKPGKGEVTEQLKRHARALVPKKDEAGVNENNYVRAARYCRECGSLNDAGMQAMIAAFLVDVESEKKKVNDDTPGAGGFLIKFAVKLQTQIDKAERVTEAADRGDPFASVETDNGSDNEIIGSHSLMSKDTKESSPFFDDARVLGSLASLSVFQLMLAEVSAPGEDRLHWQKILRHLIRFPLGSGGWERQAMALFSKNGPIPKPEEVPDLSDLRNARLPLSAATEWMTEERAKKLRQMYVDLEKSLTQFRYP